MADLKEFEVALLKRLSQGDIDKGFLKTTSSAIVNLKKQGLVIDEVFPKGKIRIDRVIINGIVDPEFWGKVKDWGTGFRRFEVFPYGIINPEGFKFKVTIGM
jgi:hypothetical protein